MALLAKGLKEISKFDCRICVTAQHREMLDPVLDLFDIKPEFDLDVMKPNQELSDLTQKILLGVTRVINHFEPDLILVHGDTTTTFAASLAGFYSHVPVGHVEAGLRTGNISGPWPEEANRKLTAILARYHFAPTPKAKLNLISENVSENNILVTGNTVIDALLWVRSKIDNTPELEARLRKFFPMLKRKPHNILVTCHRRENFGEGFENIFKVLRKIALENEDCQIIYPVHLNPKIKEPANKVLKNIKNICLLPPQDYLQFVFLMSNADLILTDSGGIQEEAPSLGKPVLVMREETERPEAVKAGTVKLVGTDPDRIEKHVEELLKDKKVYKAMSGAHNPYGDGFAARNIIEFLSDRFL